MRKVWLIGTGLIGIEYAKVLRALDVDFVAIGRGETSAKKFQESVNRSVMQGGLETYLSNNPKLPSAAIVAVGIEMLAQTTQQLLDYGVTKILVEKPGAANYFEVKKLVAAAEKTNATILLAYNRRFYSSVLKAEEIIKDDGGVNSFNFEFTEWSHVIEKLDKPKVVFDNWFLANSTHVVDTAFFLGGTPAELCSFHQGGTTWHPSASIFSGAGVSSKGALFSYQANWEAPGRWSVDILTKKHRLYLRPMETLQMQDIGSVAINQIEIDNRLDVDFKPGFYLQVKAFLQKEYSRFCTLQQQKKHIENFYLKMSGYKDKESNE